VDLDIPIYVDRSLEGAFNLTADSNLSETINLTFQGSHVITFDNNLNHKFAQTILSVVMQLQVFGGK